MAFNKKNLIVAINSCAVGVSPGAAGLPGSYGGREPGEGAQGDEQEGGEYVLHSGDRAQDQDAEPADVPGRSPADPSGLQQGENTRKC